MGTRGKPTSGHEGDHAPRCLVILRLWAALLILLLLGACSQRNESSGTGGITFTINPPADYVPTKAAAFPCDELHIVTVQAELFDSADNLIVSSAPWECDSGQGMLPDIRPGEGYTLVISLLNEMGAVRYRGIKTGLRVRMGRVTNAGGIDLERLNMVPVFEEIEAKEVRAGQTLEFRVSAVDPDGDPVTYTVLSLPEGASFTPETGRFSWTPLNGQSGVYLASFRVNDEFEEPDADILEVYIVVTGPNLPPEFDTPGTQRVQEGKTLRFAVHASDPDGDAVTYQAMSLPPGATFNASTGLFTWRPTYNQAGTYVIRFEATDDSNPPQTSSVDVTFVVANTNRSPVVEVPEGVQQVGIAGTLQFTVSATDPDGNALTYAAANLPRDPGGTYFPGVTFDDATGSFRWVAPGPAAVGEYHVLFIVTDSGKPAQRVYRTVTILVYDDVLPRRYPVLSSVGPKRAVPGQELRFTLSASDPDYPDGGLDSLNFGMEPIPGYDLPDGASLDGLTRAFSWEPLEAGNYRVRFVVRDPGDPAYMSDHEDVVITVGSVNRPPALEPIGNRVVWNKETIEFTVFATDPDTGDTLTYSAEGLPQGATFDAATHTFSWTPWYEKDKPLGTKCIPPLTATVRFWVHDSGSPRESDYEDVQITVFLE
ncbi:MAG TPA: putative Ig domain-containing protein [Deltaproteobacteria bacterium]|nr:putative Ig domain-containing protein [Deltaproteobacteria bacterium]